MRPPLKGRWLRRIAPVPERVGGSVMGSILERVGRFRKEISTGLGEPDDKHALPWPSLQDVEDGCGGYEGSYKR